MLTLYPNDVPVPVLQRYLQSVVAPRPIAFASTIDREGRVNLSPFSFFNLFSANPPVVVFSPSRRGRDNTVKHTLENVLEVPEVAINIVNYAMVQQASLASTEYPKGVNEFVKAGFHEEPSLLIAPPRVAESPACLECKVTQIIPLGEGGGAGNLVICEVVVAHFKEAILDDHNEVDPFKLDAVARMGGNWYCRASDKALFEVVKPLQKQGIGFDGLPDDVIKSRILSGNDLAMLANVESLPSGETVAEFRNTILMRKTMEHGQEAMHSLAKEFLQAGEVENAWKVLLAIREG